MIRVLLVDDSEIFRTQLRQALSTDPEIEVAGEARDGIEALEKLEKLRPSIVTMDLNMPRLGGLETIEQIMKLRPTPILVITDRPRREGVDMTFASLTRGAADLLPKTAFEAGSAPAAALIERVKQIARGQLPRAGQGSAVPVPALGRPISVVALGASTGGPAAIAQLLTALPKGYPLPILVVQHMDEQFHDGLHTWLQRLAPVPVAFARDGDPVARPGVWLAPHGRDLEVDGSRTLRLVTPSGRRRHVPSVDSLFHSLASSHGPSACGVLLTGMGDDGAAGLEAMKKSGGLTVAQDRETSIIFGMPGAAIARGAAQLVLPLTTIATLLVDCARSAHLTSSTPQPKKKTILILDDSVVVLQAVRDSLTDAGYDVVTVDNPLVMPSIVRQRPIDLALIDVNMPAVAGDIVTKILAQAGVPGTKVVLYSDLSERELEVRAEACGALGYIKKRGEQHMLEQIERFLKMQ